MKKQMAFRKTLLAGTVSFLLGLGGCAFQSDDTVFSDDTAFVNEEIPFDDEFVIDDACTSDDGDCEASDDYLTNRFTQTETTPARDMDVGLTDDSISLSRPAGPGTVSVKNKRVQIQSAATDSSARTSSAVVAKAKKNSDEAEERVLYTTVAIPEKIGTTKTTETTLSTTKVTKTPAESGIETASEEMVPLKKTITTITETTTKVKKEETTPNFNKMTLAEKIEYGESVQDWEAKPGYTLRGLLMSWGHKAGWTVVWKLDRDYHLEAGITFRGSFTEVASALVRSFARATPAPIGTFHKGNRVLVITTQENENEN